MNSTEASQRAILLLFLLVCTAVIGWVIVYVLINSVVIRYGLLILVALYTIFYYSFRKWG